MIGTVSTTAKGELAKTNGCEFIINYKYIDFDKFLMNFIYNK